MIEQQIKLNSMDFEELQDNYPSIDWTQFRDNIRIRTHTLTEAELAIYTHCYIEKRIPWSIYVDGVLSMIVDIEDNRGNCTDEYVEFKSSLELE